MLIIHYTVTDFYKAFVKILVKEQETKRLVVCKADENIYI